MTSGSILYFHFYLFLNLFFKVTAKRTNIPGMKQFRPRRPNPYAGFPPRGSPIPPYLYSPYGYGYAYLKCAFNFCFLLYTNILYSHFIHPFFFFCFSSSLRSYDGLLAYFLSRRKVLRFRMPMRYSPYNWRPFCLRQYCWQTDAIDKFLVSLFFSHNAVLWRSAADLLPLGLMWWNVWELGIIWVDGGQCRKDACICCTAYVYSCMDLSVKVPLLVLLIAMCALC